MIDLKEAIDNPFYGQLKAEKGLTPSQTSKLLFTPKNPARGHSLLQMEPLGASYFQGSYIQGGRQVSGSIADNSALRNACERIERIEHVIEGTHPLASTDICQPCLNDVSRKVDRHVRDARSVMKAYDNVLQSSSTEASRRTPNSVPSSTSRAIDQYLQSVDLAHLLATSDDLARDIQQLEEDERRLTEQEATNCAQRRSLLQQLSQQSLEEADLEYCLSRYEQALPRLHTLLDASGHELNYLQRQNSTTRTLSISLSPLFDTVQVYRSQYGILNGRRLAYVEQPQCKLLWDEINASWRNLAAMLHCVRNATDLPSGIRMQKAHHVLYQSLNTDLTPTSPTSNTTYTTRNTSTTSVRTAFEYSHIVQLRPFQDHTLVQVHCTRTYSAHTYHNATPHSTNQDNTGHIGHTAVREFVLHLEGGVSGIVQSANHHSDNRRHHNTVSGYDDANYANREYRTAVLTLVCGIISTILEIHYQEGTKRTFNPSSDGVSSDSVNSCIFAIDTLFDGLMQDLACVLVITGDQLCFAVPQHTAHPHTLYTSSIGHTATIGSNENNPVRDLTSNGFTIYSIYPTNSSTNSSPTNTNANANANTTVNVGIVNASTLANSVLANSTLLRTTLFDSVAYFGAYAGITGSSTAMQNNNNTDGIGNNSTDAVPNVGDFTPPRRVVSAANSPVKPSERVAYDTSTSNPATPHSNVACNNSQSINSSENSKNEENVTREKYTRRVRLLLEYKQYCVHTNTPCDVYSALLVCSELALREVEVMQKVVIDLMHTLNRNFCASV